MGANTLGNGLKIESFLGGNLQVTPAKRVQERLNIFMLEISESGLKTKDRAHQTRQLALSKAN